MPDDDIATTDTPTAQDAGPPPTEAERAAIRGAAVDVHPPTALERGSYRAIRGLFLGLAKVWFRLEVRGRDNVPASGPFVVAPVHRSNLDFVLVSTIRPHRMRYMGKASIWKYPRLGRFFPMLGAFPVPRGTAAAGGGGADGVASRPRSRLRIARCRSRTPAPGSMPSSSRRSRRRSR